MLSPSEREVWLRYKTPGCSALHRIKVNAFHISVANSLEHERAKFELAYKLLEGTIS